MRAVQAGEQLPLARGRGSRRGTCFRAVEIRGMHQAEGERVLRRPRRRAGRGGEAERGERDEVERAEQVEKEGKANRANPRPSGLASRAVDADGVVRASSAPSSRKRSGLNLAASSQLASDLMKAKSGTHMIAPCSPRPRFGTTSDRHGCCTRQCARLCTLRVSVPIVEWQANHVGSPLNCLPPKESRASGNHAFPCRATYSHPAGEKACNLRQEISRT